MMKTTHYDGSKTTSKRCSKQQNMMEVKPRRNEIVNKTLLCKCDRVEMIWKTTNWNGIKAMVK